MRKRYHKEGSYKKCAYIEAQKLENLTCGENSLNKPEFEDIIIKNLSTATSPRDQNLHDRTFAITRHLNVQNIVTRRLHIAKVARSKLRSNDIVRTCT
jgi:hypothetical protein